MVDTRLLRNTDFAIEVVEKIVVLERKKDETPSVKDFGAIGNGTTNDLKAIRDAISKCRKTLSDGSRFFSGEILLPPGRYLIDDVLDLCSEGPVSGLTLSGSGVGCTELVYVRAQATIKAQGARDLTFRDMTFRSFDPSVDVDLVGTSPLYGIDLRQNAFTISHSFGIDQAALRSWKFERVNFAGFYKCFDVSGASMCSEFFFSNVGFLQCFIGVDNSNDQAVNWNFVNCNWENEGLDLTGTDLVKKDSVVFKLQKGMFTKWTGGSFISYGPLVTFNLRNPFMFAATSHKLVFDGIRIERVNDNGSCSPLFDRPENGTYFNAGNSPSVSLINSSLLAHDGIPNTVTHFKVWDNVLFCVDNCELERGRILGLYSPITQANTGEFILTRSSAMDYYEDVTNQAGTHVSHSVTIDPQNRGSEIEPVLQQRTGSLTTPSVSRVEFIHVRSGTGSLPLGGTTVNLPRFKKHTNLLRIVIRRFTAANFSLKVQLRDRIDVSTYAEAVLNSGSDRTAFADINAEIGFQISTNTELMLKFIGEAEQVKGIVGVEYI